MAEIRTEIEIDAPVNEVWAILTDIKNGFIAMNAALKKEAEKSSRQS